MLKNGKIVDRVTHSRDAFQIVCPHFAGLSAEEVDLVGCLPIGDANGAMLAAADTLGASGIYAGILAADPFRPAPMLVGMLRTAGIRAVVNLPTVAALTDGIAEALSHAGADYRAELATLALAASEGLDAMAVVVTPAQARLALEGGLRRLLVYPTGIDSADMALDVVRTIRQAAPDATVLGYRHPDDGSNPAPFIADCDGIVDWAVSTREMAKSTA